MIDSEKFDELQAELSDLSTRNLEASISDAASCETQADFITNLDDAIDAAEELLRELKSICKNCH